MISKGTIDEVLLRNDIESLIGSYVSLKRAGSRLKGLCPFHSEKTPSFVVYPEDNSYFCFGCNAGGNAITFIRQMEHLDWVDAIEFLAKRAGITVIRENEKEYTAKKPGITKDRLLKMNTDAAIYFNRMLFDNNPKSRAALAYFTEERRLSVATIRHFGLGYAPDSFDALQQYLMQKGYTRDELFEGFLASKSEKGHYYDSFRNRVMFPIIDVTGNVIAFGGRVMDDSKPKYRNSMDTPTFKKSRNLFALNFAKNSGAERIILCEGYMDVIALHAAGFTNAVATLGTAITTEQARLLSRYTKNVILSYDADEAGQKAARRAMSILGEVGIDVGVIKVNGAKDPDEYIKKYGKEKFADILNNSKTRFEYNMDSILSRHNLSIPQERINAIGELEELISNVYSKAERDVYIQVVAKELDVKASSISEDVERLYRRNLNAQKKKQNETIKQQAAGYSDRINIDFAKAPAVANCEENVLGLLLLYPDHRVRVFKENLISEDDFFTDFNKRVFAFIKRTSCAQNTEQVIDINEEFSAEEVGRITKMKVSRMALTDNSDAVLDESIMQLKNSLNKKMASSATSIDQLNSFINSIRDKETKG